MCNIIFNCILGILGRVSFEILGVKRGEIGFISQIGRKSG
jgi:hypothetical protein